jgi:hypothetical protein
MKLTLREILLKGGMGRRIRKSNRGGKCDQSILCAYIELLH